MPNNCHILSRQLELICVNASTHIMRTKKINLLTDRGDYHRYEKIFYWIRIATIALAVITVLVVSVFFIMLSVQNSRIESLLQQKKQLLLSLQDKNDVEAKIGFIQNKYNSLKDFMKDDAHSLPYYNLLQSALSSSTESAALKSFQISKTRDVTFVVSFLSIEQLLSFFKFVESEDFLKYFEKISLKSFSIAGASQSTNLKYELSFNARFLEINE